MTPEIHQQRLSHLIETFSHPLINYFPNLESTVRHHLEIWTAFNADETAEVTKVVDLINSLINIADVITQSLRDLKLEKGWQVAPPSIYRKVWQRNVTEGELFGYIRRKARDRGYLFYGSFRRVQGSDLTLLFQMLDPGEDTGELGQEVHCRIDMETEGPRAIAQGLEVYRVLNGYVDIEVDEEKHRIGPDYKYDTVIVPPGSRHRVINTSRKTSQVLIIMGGGSARGFKITPNDGMIEIEKGIRIPPPVVPERFSSISRFRKETHEHP